jgi:hypothetical protein
MSLFSQRKGFKPIKTVMQVDSMDDELRNGLWNVLTISYWNQVKDNWISLNKKINILFKLLWDSYFKKPFDTLRDYWPDTYKEIREYFFYFHWYEVYDFIEFIANNYPDEFNEVNPKFMDFCNIVLERELSAYRFVGDKITQITSKEEVLEIEEALEISKPLKAVNTHLKRALDLLADRKSPDYRNSIKESISAVESICNLITKEKKATLGQALKKIEDKVSLHPALISAFNSLYGYTSDAEGIRHALLDETNLSFEDAKFMLVSCSAFVNYLINKASKVGITI